MGGCFSKKSTNSSSSAPLQNPPKEIKSNVQLEKNKVEEETGKKEIFIIKHRKSQDIERRSNNDEKVDVKKVTEIAESCKPVDCNNGSNGSGILVAAPVRTSSCTKEELDAILIQCGRLSRSSSTGKAAGVSASSGSGENNGSVQRVKKYSGSKRSFDFDNGNNGDESRDEYGRKRDGFEENVERDDDNGVVAREGPNRHRQQQRQSRTAGSPSKGRRRTPSREREQGQRQQSGNRDSSSSSSGSGGRRVSSRSPGRRSESPITTTSSGANVNSTNGRPGKMVSVPATVSSLAMDKSNNAERNETISASAKRTQVKRSAGSEVAAVGARTSASPRARSPARANVKILNDNQNGSSNQIPQQPVSLSRSNSRKAEVSPFRRNPLGEIDNNALVDQIPVQGLKAPSSILHQAPSQKLNAGHTPSERTSEHGHDNKTCIGKGTVEKNANNASCIASYEQHSNAEEAKGPQAFSNNVAVNVVASGTECFKPQALTRTRSSRLSRDLDIDPEVLSNPAPSYTSLLLDDIQNFHQTSNPTFTLPACVSKAHSIVEAVADLNSSTKPNLSSAFSNGKKGRPTAEQFNKSYDNGGLETLTAGTKGLESQDHFMQSEVVADDDLMKPSFHRYVTVQRGSLGEDIEEQESSGSNSFVGSQQHWVSSSSWEPDSADSTGRTSSRSNSRDDDRCPLGSQRQAISESGHDGEEVLRRLSGKRRESNQQSGIGRGRVGSRGQDRLPTAAIAAAST